MWFQLVYLYCAIGSTTADTCSLTSAKVIEIAPAYLSETECRQRLGDIPHEAKVENDPRSGTAVVTCATREDIRHEVQKSEAELVKHLEPPPEPPAPSADREAG